MSDISDGALVANEVIGPGITQVFVEDAVQAFRLVLVAIDAVLDLFGGVAGELEISAWSYPANNKAVVVWTNMIRLSLHRSNTRILEEQPIVHLQ